MGVPTRRGTNSLLSLDMENGPGPGGGPNGPGPGPAGVGQLIVEFAGGTTQDIITDSGAAPIIVWEPITVDGLENYVVATGEYTVPKSGFYEIQCRVHYAAQIGVALAGATRSLNLQIDGVSRRAQDNMVIGDVPVSPLLPRPLTLLWRGDLGQGDVLRVVTEAVNDTAASVQEFGSVPGFDDAGRSWWSIVEDYRFIRP